MTTYPRFHLTLAGGAILALAAMWAWPRSHQEPIVVHAQSGCAVANLNGSYGYVLTGTFYDNTNALQPFSSAGLLTADGQGNLTSGTETDAIQGTSVPGVTYTGTYTVNSNCTGTFTQNADLVGGPFNYAFVITDGGNGLQIVEADDGAQIAGTARKQ